MLWNVVKKMETIINKWDDLKKFSTYKVEMRGRKPLRRETSNILINDRGCMSLSPIFNKKAKIDKFLYVSLSYSPANKGIVFDFLTERSLDKCFKITSISHGFKLITCRSFFRHFKISYTSLKEYTPTLQKFTDGKSRWVMCLAE